MTYSEKVIEHYEHPAQCGHARQERHQRRHRPGRRAGLRRRDEAARFKVVDGIIEDAKFKTFGLRLGDRIELADHRMGQGKSLDEAASIKKHPDRAAPGAARRVKIHCSVLAEDAIKAAVADYRDENRHPRPRPPRLVAAE